jgi:ABC-2 type transport system ATP-binding protein
LELLLIAFENLEVRYAAAGVPALKGLTLSLERGIVGLLGPNGAGKSTLLKALLGLLAPSRGSGTVLGVPLGGAASSQLRSRIGYMPEYDALIEDASAYEQVAFWGELSGLAPEAARDRAHEVLYFVGLDESRYRPVSGYSTGMRQRVKLAQALVHSPELIFLDEPTNGLDPDGRRRMLDLVLRVHAELGTGVLLASHLLGDVERVADQLVILDEGLIKAAGSMAGLRKALARRVELRFLNPLDPAQEAALAALGTVLEARNGLYDLELIEADPAHVFRWAQAAGATLVQVTPRHDRLDEVLLRALHGDVVRGAGLRPTPPESLRLDQAEPGKDHPSPGVPRFANTPGPPRPDQAEPGPDHPSPGVPRFANTPGPPRPDQAEPGPDLFTPPDASMDRGH